MNISIETTRDYSLFQRIDGNRKPSEAHVKKLTKAISENPKLSQYDPILVNSKYEVIDGQHRLEALKRLDQPVHYIRAKKLKLKDVQALNSNQKVWSPLDYAKSYAELGIEDYEIYIEYKHKYKLNHDILLKYLSLEKIATADMFREGKFKVTNQPLDYVDTICQNLTDIADFFKQAKKRAFAMAYLTVVKHKDYDHSRMMKAIEREGHKMIDYGHPQGHLRQLEEIYNWHYPEKEQVRFF